MVFAAVLLASALPLLGQSSSQEFPTAVFSNEISGSIKARDIGDSRITTYYFTFNGDQGDLFINLVTRNLTGDIDVFAASGLRPLSKITVYADLGDSETGRAIYLRKPEKLLLRVQGRTPNDDEATFKLKFAGSFVAARPDEVPGELPIPKVNAESRAGIRVNSVGTILPSPPMQVPAETQAVEKENPPAEVLPAREKPAAAMIPGEKKNKTERPAEALRSDPAETKSARPEKTSTRRNSASRRATPAKRPPAKTEAEVVKAAEKERTVDSNENVKPEESRSENDRPAPKKSDEPADFRTLTDKKRVAARRAEEKKPDPLASINLVIQFKDGRSIEKKMNEVFKFSVDKGVLTVILKNGGVSRFQIVDVAKVTIE